MHAITKDPTEVKFIHHKFEDLHHEVMIERELGDFLRFNQYEGVQLPIAGSIKVRYRSYYEDVTFAEVDLQLHPTDSRKAYMNLDSASIEVNRSHSIFFDCVGRDKISGLKVLLFYGVFQLKA